MVGSREEVEVRAVDFNVAVVVIVVVIVVVGVVVVGFFVYEGDGVGSVAVVYGGDEGEYGDGETLVGAAK